MKQFIDIKVVLLVSIFFFSACSSFQEPSGSANVETIEQLKHTNSKKQIHISSPRGYKAYIDRDDNLQYICMSKSDEKCNYYSPEKHSYKNGTPSEEYIWINQSGYYPPLSTSTHDVVCGIGSLWGWIALFTVKPFGIENYTKKHPVACNSRFTQIDSTLIGPRLVFGLVTFGTPLITGGTMHTNKFDRNEFIDTVYVSNIDTFRTKLLNITKKYKVDGGLDIIYIEQGDVKDDLQEKYELLLKNKSLLSGVVFLEKETNRLLSIVIFNKYKDKNVLEAVSLEIEELLQEMAKNNQYVLKYDDIIPYIPKEISVPKISPIKHLIKSEFETKKEFENRVQNRVREREKRIRSLQREYSLKVFERNRYIDTLQKSYEKYLKDKMEEKNIFLSEIKENIPLLSKLLFLENTSGFFAKNFKYDAETEKLYFTIYSKRREFTHDVVAVVPASEAKSMKIKHTFRILPEINLDKNRLSLKGFSILNTQSGNQYPAIYTNINFKPEFVSLRVTGMKEGIKKEINNYFKKYKQKDTPIVDTSKKEIWYIDIVKTNNAKIPKWFATQPKNKIIGYGQGKTLKDAKAEARDDLAHMIQVKVSSKLTSIQEVDDFKSFSKFKSKTQQSSDIILSSESYRLYKQESIDGIWYVGFEYIN